MSNKTYDFLKNLCLIVIPVIAFVSTLCGIWNVPYTEQITATLVATETLLGALVKVASVIYNKGKQEQLEEAQAINGQNRGD